MVAARQARIAIRNGESRFAASHNGRLLIELIGNPRALTMAVHYLSPPDRESIKSGATRAALERAGWALAIATMHHHDEFEKFLTAHRGELTSDQIAYLKKLGLG